MQKHFTSIVADIVKLYKLTCCPLHWKHAVVWCGTLPQQKLGELQHLQAQDATCGQWRYKLFQHQRKILKPLCGRLGCLLYGSPSKLLHGDSASTSQRALCQRGPERAVRCQGDIILPCLKCGTSVSCEQSIAERNCTTM